MSLEDPSLLETSPAMLVMGQQISLVQVGWSVVRWVVARAIFDTFRRCMPHRAACCVPDELGPACYVVTYRVA